MKVNVLYFASLREHLGRQGDALEVPPAATVADVWRIANPDEPLPANVLVAVDQEYASLDAPVGEGCEVAFFPPVTGG